MFKPGDIVIPRGNHWITDGEPPVGDRREVVVGATFGQVELKGSEGYPIPATNFTPHRIVSATVEGKVGPFIVYVQSVVSHRTSIQNVSCPAVEKVLDEVADDYLNDPDMGQDDILTRLQDRLEAITSVVNYSMTSLDGVGVKVILNR